MIMNKHMKNWTKIQKWCTVGFISNSFSYGEIYPSVSYGRRLITWAAVLMHLAQNCVVTFLACIMLRQTSAKCLFFLSATPCCWGVLGQVNCLRILPLFNYAPNWYELYSPPLSILRHLIWCIRSFSTFSWNSTNLACISDFSFKSKSTQNEYNHQ